MYGHPGDQRIHSFPMIGVSRGQTMWMIILYAMKQLMTCIGIELNLGLSVLRISQTWIKYSLAIDKMRRANIIP